MSDIVFSLSNTFSEDPRDGALGINEAKRFYIAPYQRGYKWSSSKANSPVQLLMSDLKDAFSTSPKQYYLQFITVITANHKGEKVLEVIDGQQRLTTITLLFSVINNELKSTEKPFTHEKLTYEVRDNVSSFLKDFIYKDINVILGLNWTEFIEKHPLFDEQDIFYLFHAAHKIKEMLPNDILKFCNYISEYVMLIVNTVERTISSEKIFSNLNTNKVELTSVELIKALLLTKSVREAQTKSYKEILEQRTSMGRQWDEIDNWANRADINSFFFKKAKDPIYELLLLIAKKEDYTDKTEGRYDLFNFYQSQIKKGAKSAKEYFLELKKVKSILNDLYLDPICYNSLGFLFSLKETKIDLSSYFGKLEYSKKVFIQELHKDIKKILPSDFSSLNYGENDGDIHNLLLSISVFGNDDRFDFYSFNENNWSLEHIFPQTPDKFSSELKQQDINLINSIIGAKLKAIIEKENVEKESKDYILHLKIQNKLQQTQCKLDDDEKELLCNLLKTKKINGIGNMALLTPPDNSSNSNGMFDSKRLNIVKRVSKGSFVPKHTYDVFSKLISEKMSPNLSVWSEIDIDEHAKWIEITINNQLLKYN